MSQSQTNTQSKATFLDANVLLEIILGRANKVIAREFIEDHSENLLISSLTAYLITHFGIKIVDLPILCTFLVDYTILSLDTMDFEWVFMNARDKDFENALQLAVAIRNSCTKFVTFDKGLFKTYADVPSIQIQLLQ